MDEGASMFGYTTLIAEWNYGSLFYCFGFLRASKNHFCHVRDSAARWVRQNTGCRRLGAAFTQIILPGWPEQSIGVFSKSKYSHLKLCWSTGFNQIQLIDMVYSKSYISSHVKPTDARNNNLSRRRMHLINCRWQTNHYLLLHTDFFDNRIFWFYTELITWLKHYSLRIAFSKKN